MITVIINYIMKFFHWFDVPSQGLVFLNKGYRSLDLLYCYQGLLKTKQSFLCLNNNNLTLIEGRGDDLAQYYFIPKILYLINAPANLLYIERFQKLFYAFIVFISFIILLYGLKILYKKLNLINTILIRFLSLFSLYSLSTYTLNFFIISFIPLIIYIINKYLINKNKYYILFFITIGFIISLSNSFRAFSGTGVLLFISIYIILIERIKLLLKNKIYIIMAIFILINSINIYFDYIIKKRNYWLLENNHSAVVKDSKPMHSIWSDLYIGLAYVQPNKYKIGWEDQFAIDKANKEVGYKKWTYNTMDSELEDIIKKEVLKILKEDPFFIFQNIIKKAKKVIITIFYSINIGLIFIFINKTDKKIIISSLVTILFYSIPPILVWPDPRYFLGAICMSVLLTIFLINDFLVFRQTQSA